MTEVEAIPLQYLIDAARHAEMEMECSGGWIQIELVLAPDGVHVKGRKLASSMVVGRTRLVKLTWPHITGAATNTLITTVDFVIRELAT